MPGQQGVERVNLERAWHCRMIMAAAFLAFTIVMIKMGSEATPRLVAPYYLVLLPAVLMHPVNTRLVRKSWWRIVAAVCIASTALVVFLTPARPLWPAETVLDALQSKWPHSKILARAEQVYSVYRQRNDLLGPLRDSLPVTAKDICLIAGGDDSDLALWRPFGSSKVSHLVGPHWENDSQECNWVVGKTTLIPSRYGLPLDELVLRAQGQLIARKTITSKVTTGPEEWFVAHLWVLSSDSFPRRQLESALVLTVVNKDPRNRQP